MAHESPLRRGARRFQPASTTASNSMEVPRLSLDALNLARALVAAVSAALAQLRARPRGETALKAGGGVAAALLALKFAKSLRAAGAVGLLAGVFAHSLYADVVRKKPPALGPTGLVGGGTPREDAPRDEADDGDAVVVEEAAVWVEADARRPRSVRRASLK